MVRVWLFTYIQLNELLKFFYLMKIVRQYITINTKTNSVKILAR